MKLRTIGVGFARGTLDDFAHDAAAAHALMQALCDFDNIRPYLEKMADLSTWIEQRADELMREWGYE